MGKEGSDIQDEDWIIAVQKGGPEHYGPFVQAYGPYIYRTVFAVLRSPHDAEDVTQEVLLQIYRSLPDCRLDGLKTWITRIAVNRSIDFKRSRARRPEELADSDAMSERMQEENSVMPAAELVAIEQADRQQVRERVEEMPDNYREVVTAFYMEDKSYEQIAAETGLERKSVESRLYRARSWMKRHWRKEDFE
ncbi:sigma-70 family RNA polymerase sigma factor [Paenibacillus sp. LPE1-1-1.1]